MKKSVMLLIAATSLLLGACSTTHRTTKWEYKVVSGVKAANDLGEEGWSAVGFNTDQGYDWILLKRPKE